MYSTILSFSATAPFAHNTPRSNFIEERQAMRYISRVIRSWVDHNFSVKLEDTGVAPRLPTKVMFPAPGSSTRTLAGAGVSPPGGRRAVKGCVHQTREKRKEPHLALSAAQLPLRKRVVRRAP